MQIKRNLGLKRPCDHFLRDNAARNAPYRALSKKRNIKHNISPPNINPPKCKGPPWGSGGYPGPGGGSVPAWLAPTRRLERLEGPWTFAQYKGPLIETQNRLTLSNTGKIWVKKWRNHLSMSKKCKSSKIITILWEVWYNFRWYRREAQGKNWMPLVFPKKYVFCPSKF